MSCAEQPEDGSWINADPSTRGLTHADFRFICQDQVLTANRIRLGRLGLYISGVRVIRLTATGERLAPSG